jgi:hypothetical protein
MLSFIPNTAQSGVKDHKEGVILGLKFWQSQNFKPKITPSKRKFFKLRLLRVAQNSEFQIYELHNF